MRNADIWSWFPAKNLCDCAASEFNQTPQPDSFAVWVSFWLVTIVWWHRLDATFKRPDVNVQLLLHCTFSCTLSLTLSSPAMVRSGLTSLSVTHKWHVSLWILYHFSLGFWLANGFSPLTGYFTTSWFGLRLTACVCGWDYRVDDFLKKYIPTCVWMRPKPELKMGRRPCVATDRQGIRVAHTANMQKKKTKEVSWVCRGSREWCKICCLQKNGIPPKICVYTQCIGL